MALTPGYPVREGPHLLSPLQGLSSSFLKRQARVLHSAWLQSWEQLRNWTHEHAVLQLSSFKDF